MRLHTAYINFISVVTCTCVFCHVRALGIKALIPLPKAQRSPPKRKRASSSSSSSSSGVDQRQQRRSARLNPALGVRRSPRLQHSQGAPHEHAADHTNGTKKGNSTAPFPSDAPQSYVVAKQEPPGPSAVQQAQLQASARSCKFVTARVKEFQDKYIGLTFYPTTGQQMKMEVMSRLGQVKPTFSRMSGIQEFRNCVALFVNVGGVDYDNVFDVHSAIPPKKGGSSSVEARASHKHKRRKPTVAQPVAVKREPKPQSPMGSTIDMTWFAQNRQSVDSPVIQRLLRPTTTVLLFCRLTGKQSQPYVYCGQLACIAFDPTASPLRFKWRLKDASQVWCASVTFREMLNTGRSTDPSSDD